MRVVDGDTVHVRVDLGCEIRIDMTLRLYGINTPEMNTAAGKTAKAVMIEQLPTTENALIVRTYKDAREKYGRYLATIMVGRTDVNQWMVKQGHAVVYLP